MSRIHQRLQALHKEAGDSWFLKVTTGQKYGPVSIATLREWAAEGRVAADSMVSHDGRSWLPAESLPGLEMDWIVTLPDGTSYGPFNLRATRHLVNIGLIDQEAVVRNRHTGVELAVKAVLEAKDLSLLIREARERPPVIEVSEVAELRTVSPDLSRTVKELSGEAQAKVAELDTVRRHLEEEKVRRAEVEARCTELEKKIREQFQELERVAGAKDQETAAVRAELAALKEGQAEAEQRMAAREQELQNRIRELEEEMASGTELLAQAQEQLRSQQAAWREEKARAAEQIRELKEKLEKVEEETGTSRATAEKLRRELEALQVVASEKTELAATREKELEGRLANLAAELQSARQERDELQRELALSAEKLSLAEKEAKASEAQFQQKIEELDQLVAQARQEGVALRNSLEKAEIRAAELERKSAEREKEYKSETERLQRAVAATRQELAQRQEELKTLRATLESNRAELEELRAQLADEKALREQAEQRLASLSIGGREREAPAAGWYLRTNEKEVCGPVSLEQLCNWAAECRIAPEHEASNDGETWYPAPSLRELKMEWTVVLGDGTLYGPLHLFAVQDLIEDGIVATDSEVTNVVTGKKVRADLLYVEEFALLEEQNRMLAARLEETARLLSAAEERIRHFEREREVPAAAPAKLPPKAVREQLRKIIFQSSAPG